MKIKSFVFAIIFMSINAVELTAQVQYIIPKTSKVPVIDGKMDEMWEFVPRISDFYLILEKEQESIPDNWLDANPSFRLMWDDQNIYIYAETHDDTLHKDGLGWNQEKSRGYNDDCFELFFDGNNSHGDWDGIDDSEIWFLIEEPDVHFYTSATAPIPLDGIVFEQQTWKNASNTKIGWSIEIAIPLADLSIQPLAGYIFGLDLKYSDDDGRELNDANWSPGKDREHNFRWCQNYDQHPPSTWYRVELGNYEVMNYIHQELVSSIQIDGQVDDDWNFAPWYSGNVYRQTENMVLFSDASYQFKCATNGIYTYLLVQIDDNQLLTEKDKLTVYIDGDGITGNEFDANTFAFSYTFKENPIVLSSPSAVGNTQPDLLQNIQSASQISDKGVLIEIALPMNELNIHQQSFAIELTYTDYDGNDLTPCIISFRDSTGNLATNPSNYTMVMKNADYLPGILADSEMTIHCWYTSHNQCLNIQTDKLSTRSYASTADFRLNIYDILGKKVWNTSTSLSNSDHSKAIYLPLPNGIYICEMTQHKASFTGKFVVSQ